MPRPTLIHVIIPFKMPRLLGQDAYLALGLAIVRRYIIICYCKQLDTISLGTRDKAKATNSISKLYAFDRKVPEHGNSDL